MNALWAEEQESKAVGFGFHCVWHLLSNRENEHMEQY